ncbi:hypothetical protein HG536_0A03250 [Torulaspora globosa]|uniref:Major facilitator superfamily (MFS) profile domain-containing protein n=1 Tax=Torulaspora globosa TaxID=48254 RepID=A0A7G3ZAH1_9SACH|nr:uncharacterized protein HG536_0A03250 [Torulaspora globosa]QLL30507.1 hypothetical protein HG536_0A03250 [Torulaspora globosa]
MKKDLEDQKVAIDGSPGVAEIREGDPLDSSTSQSSKETVVKQPARETAQQALGVGKTTGIALYLCVFSLALSLFLAALDIMIVSSIVETVANQFGDYSKTGWIFAGYSLPNAVLSLIWGRIAAVVGFKTSVLTAIVIFEVGSLVAGVAHSMDMLIGGRVIAGIGGSGIQGLAFIIGSTLVDESKRGLIIACMGGAFGVASVAGPFLGGAFTTHVTWRWCFYINLPVGGLAFAFLVLFYHPNGKKLQSTRSTVVQFFNNLWAFAKRLRELFKLSTWKTFVHELIFKFDIIESLLCSAGLVLILLAFSFGGSKYAWNSAPTIVMFVVGISLTIFALIYDFVIFPRLKVVRTNPRYQPLIPWKIFSKFSILVSNVTVFFTCMAFMCQVIYVVQFFQLIYDETAWKASVHSIAMVVPTVITVMTSGIFNAKLGLVKPVALVGAFSGIIGAGLLTLLDNTSTTSQHIGLLILPGIAFGATMQSSLIGSQIQLDKKSETYRMDFIAVTTLNNFLKNLGQAIGGVVCNTVFTTSITNKMRQHHIDIGQNASADAVVVYRTHHFDGSRSLLGDLLSDSIKNVFYMALGFSALAFIFGIFTSNKKLDMNKAPAKAEESGSEDSSSDNVNS